MNSKWHAVPDGPEQESTRAAQNHGHILVFERDSHAEWFEGNFEACEEDKKRRLGTDALIPHRIKFQKFRR